LILKYFFDIIGSAPGQTPEAARPRGGSNAGLFLFQELTYVKQPEEAIRAHKKKARRKFRAFVHFD